MNRFDLMGMALLFMCALLLLLTIGTVGAALGIASTYLPVRY